MADQEIAKHTKKVLQLIGEKEHGWRHKLAEMAQEIIIIVFAVSLSIWLHGWFEHRQEQQEVKTFLLGLRQDVQRDIALLADIAAADHLFDANFAYLAKLAPGTAADAQPFNAAYDKITNNFFFTPQNSRFDGFKSSGKLTNIEQEALLEHILTLYQSKYPEIRNSQNGWSHTQDELTDYLEKGLVGDDGTAERYALIVAPKGKRLLRRAATQAQLYQRYKDYAAVATRIVAEIDQLYPAATGAQHG